MYGMIQDYTNDCYSKKEVSIEYIFNNTYCKLIIINLQMYLSTVYRTLVVNERVKVLCIKKNILHDFTEITRFSSNY